MNSKFKVWTVWEIKTGEVALSGAVEGPRLTTGLRGFAETSFGPIETVIVGIGISDPNIGPPDRQGILLKMLKGKPADLDGATIEFSSA